LTGEHTFQVFSDEPLSKSQLESLFENPQDVVVDDWLAYPHYNTEPRTDNFLLSPGLYHLNAIEWAASAMEMSLVAAKNIAILVRNQWCAKGNCPASTPKHEEL